LCTVPTAIPLKLRVVDVVGIVIPFPEAITSPVLLNLALSDPPVVNVKFLSISEKRLQMEWTGAFT
jgi:hypothetical protein